MKLWLLKIKISLTVVGKVLRKPLYSLVAIAAGSLALGILLWVFNLNLLGYIITNPDISFGDKILFFLQSYTSVFTNTS